MNLNFIRTDAEYREALRIASLMFNNPPDIGTPEGDEFESLLREIEHYERKTFVIDKSD